MNLWKRYWAWRARLEGSGDGPIIWWPIGRLRVYLVLDNWSLPLAAEWVDSGEGLIDRATRFHEQGLMIGFLCFAFYIDLTVTTKVVVV